MTATITPPAATGVPPASPPPPSAQASRRVHAGGVANVAVAALTLAAVAALGRLFVHPGGFVWPVAATAIVAHVVAWQCRRARLPLVASAALTALASVLCVAWTVLGHSTAYGLPWRGTWHAASLALSAASEVYRNSAPPAPALPGFALAGALGAACAAFLADWAAFRMRATTEACLPSFSLFVLSCALAQGHRVVSAAAIWLGALLVFLLVRQAALDGVSTAWFASRSRRGPASILAVGSALAGLAVLAAATLGTQLPGATVKPIVNWRHETHNDGGRNTGSPLVDIKARLKDKSQQEVFTVATDRPSYWRLTSLDTFDGSGWSLNDTYQRAGSSLPPTPAVEGTVNPPTPLHADFRVGALSSIWLPAGYRPVRLSGVRHVSYSADASSLITDRATSDGLTYSVDSEVPAPTTATLEAAPRADASDPAIARYLQLPRSVPSSVLSIAVRQTAGARTPYEQALMLQNWLRGPSFRYSLDVPPDDSQDALVNFLTKSKTGFCQQFAGSYAVLARELGLPARVAVGFTEGERSPDGLWHVRDEHAHAWPEVYFPGSGWISFEPTPGRGSPDPQQQAITGVQGPPPPTTPAAPAPTTTAAPAGASPTTTPGSPKDRSLDQNTKIPVRHHSSNPLLVLLAGLILIPVVWAILLGVAGALVAARRRARADSVRGVVALAWSDAREALTRQQTPPRPSETPAEYARRAARSAGLGVASAGALARLAHLVEVSDYSPAEPQPSQADDARAAALVVSGALVTRRPWWVRAGQLLDPRPLRRALGALTAR